MIKTLTSCAGDGKSFSPVTEWWLLLSETAGTGGFAVHQLAYSSPSLPSTANKHLCPSEQSHALLQFKLDFTIDSFASADCDYDEQYS
ncbi:hypothetical protein RJ639_046256 [Escallonia herrerae]|uniref:Uncharacterized protein n=1 Tax=Escallonia herrerae TaxID=1293975 RepID=A0AA88W6X8_9ASTE|nr:hypothetical protein RJ639_046256 [Escallonia herrerae]